MDRNSAGTMTIRGRHVEAARELKSARLNECQIVERLGVSRSYAYELLNDPDGSRARERKARYAGRCVDCGKPTNNSGSVPPERCRQCRVAFVKANKRWTREAIILAIQSWAALYGTPPTANAWLMSVKCSSRNRERFHAGSYPHTTEVGRMFGSFSAGLRAAGFESRCPLAGKPRNRVAPEDYVELVRMRDDGAGWREIGERFGITPPTALARYQRYTRKGSGSMAGSLSAVTILERQIARFDDRRKKAEKDAADAEEQAKRLRHALLVLRGKAA